MARRKRGTGIIIGGIIVIVGVGVLLSPIGIFPPPIPFTWAIEVGDEFTFNITASGINSTNNYLAPLVNTTIQVRITSLTNNTVFSEEGFRSLVNSDKVDSMFSNGSDIPYPLKTDIADFVSRFFFPIGAWDYVDGLYPDSISEVTENPGSTWINSGLSHLFADTLYFGRITNIIDDFDAGNGWSGNISLSDGVPSCMEKWGFSFGDPDFYTWIFQLQLIEQS